MLVAAWACARQGFRTAAQYRSEFVAHSLQGAAYLLMWLSIWHAVYAGPWSPPGAPPLRETLAYAVVVQLLYTLLGDDWLLDEVFERLRSGDIAMDLVRPVPLPLWLLAQQAGHKAFFVLFSSLPLYGLVAAALSLPLPRDPRTWAGFLGFTLLAYATRRLFDLCLGLLAFWLMESRGLADMLDFATLLFGGWVVPLWFYPDTLARLAAYLPLRGLYALPASVAVGRLAPEAWAAAATVQGLWILALAALAAALWRRAVRRVAVQGG